MTTTSPSLLTLPRELRDHIYSYLTQNLNFCVFYDIDNLSEVRSEKAFTIHIENAPIAGVLLSHPRLHNEYLENPIFKTLTAAVYIDPTCGIHNERPAPQLPELTARQAESILRKVQHAIIIIDFGEANVGYHKPDFAAYWLFLRIFALKIGTPLLGLKVAASFRTNANIAPFLAHTHGFLPQHAVPAPNR